MSCPMQSIVQVDHETPAPHAQRAAEIVLAVLGDFASGHGARLTLTEHYLVIEMRAFERESELYIGVDDLLQALAEVNQQVGS